MFIIGLLVNNCNVFDGKLPTVIFVIAVLLAILAAMAIGRQPVQEIDLSFKVLLEYITFK